MEITCWFPKKKKAEKENDAESDAFHKPKMVCWSKKREWLKSNRWKNKNRFLVLVWLQLTLILQQNKNVLLRSLTVLGPKAVDKSRQEHSLHDRQQCNGVLHFKLKFSMIFISCFIAYCLHPFTNLRLILTQFYLVPEIQHFLHIHAGCEKCGILVKIALKIIVTCTCIKNAILMVIQNFAWFTTTRKIARINNVGGIKFVYFPLASDVFNLSLEDLRPHCEYGQSRIIQRYSNSILKIQFSATKVPSYPFPFSPKLFTWSSLR